MTDNLEQLRLAGETNCNLWPGDPICKWAYEEIQRLLKPAEFPSNPLNRRLSMQEISAGRDPEYLPVLCMEFKTLNDVHEAARFVMEMRHEPSPKAWMKGYVSHLGPSGPDEHDVDCVYGSDPPEGEGWQPLFGGRVYPSYGIETAVHWRANVALAQKVAKLKQLAEALHNAVSIWSTHNCADGLPIKPDTVALNKILAAYNPFDSPKPRPACICPPGVSRIDCPACGHPYLAELQKNGEG